MADKNQGKKPKKGGARTTALTGLLAVVAVIAAWLSNCIPGFGIGSSGNAEGEAEQAQKAEQARPEEAKPEQPEPEEPKPEQPEPEGAEQGEQAGKTLTVTVDVHGCAVADAEPAECASLCEHGELFEGIDDAILQVEGASHESVVAMTDCLKSKAIDKVAIRRE